MPVNPVLPSAALNSRQPRSVATRQLPEVPRGRPEGEEGGGHGAAAPPPLPTRRSAPATEDPHLGKTVPEREFLNNLWGLGTE
jgi:hypothetical protein